MDAKPNLFSRKILRDSTSNVTLKKTVDIADRSLKSSLNKRTSDSILSTDVRIKLKP